MNIEITEAFNQYVPLVLGTAKWTAIVWGAFQVFFLLGLWKRTSAERFIASYAVSKLAISAFMYIAFLQAIYCFAPVVGISGWVAIAVFFGISTLLSIVTALIRKSR